MFGINSTWKYFEAGRGLDVAIPEDEYEKALYKVHSRWDRADSKEFSADEVADPDHPSMKIGKGEQWEFRCYIKNGVLPETRRAFIRVQLRRYVCATEWSSKTKQARWDEELRGFKVKSMDDVVRIKLLIHKNKDAKIVDKLNVPLWKIRRGGGELRNKFYFEKGTPVNMILSLVPFDDDSHSSEDSVDPEKAGKPGDHEKEQPLLTRRESSSYGDDIEWI